jgi:hypothetical protein
MTVVQTELRLLSSNLGTKQLVVVVVILVTSASKSISLWRLTLLGITAVLMTSWKVTTSMLVPRSWGQ